MCARGFLPRCTESLSTSVRCRLDVDLPQKHIYSVSNRHNREEMQFNLYRSQNQFLNQCHMAQRCGNNTSGRGAPLCLLSTLSEMSQCNFIFSLSSGAKSWMCLLISAHWKGTSGETNLGDFHLLSALSCLTCHSAEVQRGRKDFHFKAPRPGLQTPFILSWMSRTDAAWPKKARTESRLCQRAKSFACIRTICDPRLRLWWEMYLLGTFACFITLKMLTD